VAQIYNNGSTNGITTVQSSDGSSFTLATSTKATNVGYVSIYYLADAPSGITSVTANHSNLDLYMNVAEYSGVSQTNPLDVKNSYFSGTATSTTYTAGGITTTQGDDLLVGNMFYGALTNTSTLPWAPITSNFAAHGDRYSVFDIQNAGNAGNYDLSGIFATPATWGADIVAFKAASVGAATTTYTQAGYQWYANQNSSTPGPVLAAQNTSTTLTATGEAFRLRMLLAVDAHGSAIGVDSFVLQFANKGTGTSCSTTQFAYANITTSTVIAYNTNSSVANGSAMTATSTDPTDAGRTVVEQTYQSGGVWGVTSTISAGQDGNWDFSLIDNGSPASTDYCFQAVYASSTPLYAYSIYPEIKTYTNPNPTVSIPIFNGGGAGITLTPNTTTTITVVASTTDPGGAGNISYATGTIYRTSLGPNCVANNLDCYQIPSSSCVFSGSTSTVTCTTGLWYFAQSTGNPSSSFPSDSWMGAITVKDGGGYATTATSTNTANVNVLTAINVTTSSINYGTLIPNTNTGSTNQTVTVQNVGNSSTTLQLSGTAFLNGGNTIATSSQHYATSTFTFGGSEPQLSDTLTTVSGFILAGPTSTSSVQGNIYWGDAVPSGMPKGTYVATTTFSAAFSH
jgi:predicted RecA/RadA family phage recombinase